MMMTAIAPPLDRALLHRVEALQTTAEYIQTLIEVVNAELSAVREGMKKATLSPAGYADLGDWRTIESLLNLAHDQAAIVNDVAVAVEAAGIDLSAVASPAPPPLPAGDFYPRLLRGAKAIGDHLGMPARTAQHMHQMGKLPTVKLDGSPVATPAALDDWRALERVGVLKAY